MTRRSRGAALLLVLWLLLLLAGLVSVFALASRTEALQGSALRVNVASGLSNITAYFQAGRPRVLLRHENGDRIEELTRLEVFTR